MLPYPDHYYVQSAVLPYRQCMGEIQILLIRSRRDRRWVVPKGIVEPDLSPQDSAVKEALEEAGIEGDVDPRAMGTYAYDKWGGTCRATVYAMAVTTEHATWPEDFRRREWVDVETAADRVREEALKAMIRYLPEHIEEA